jgi:hypothetical protein
VNREAPGITGKNATVASPGGFWSLESSCRAATRMIEGQLFCCGSRSAALSGPGPLPPPTRGPHRLPRHLHTWHNTPPLRRIGRTRRECACEVTAATPKLLWQYLAFHCFSVLVVVRMFVICMAFTLTSYIPKQAMRHGHQSVSYISVLTFT